MLMAQAASLDACRVCGAVPGPAPAAPWGQGPSPAADTGLGGLPAPHGRCPQVEAMLSKQQPPWGCLTGSQAGNPSHLCCVQLLLLSTVSVGGSS